LAQASRKKARKNHFSHVLSYLTQGVRESIFVLCGGVALYLALALASFTPSDPAWIHTAQESAVRNWGGVVGAWFADIALYFFSYMAYLLPLAVVLFGWQLRRIEKADMDAELLFFRLLGVLAILIAGAGLLDLQQIAHPHPDGNVIGHWVGTNMQVAFGPLGGPLFLLIVLLSGVSLAVNFSWLRLIETIGKYTLILAGVLWRLISNISGWLLRKLTATAPVSSEPEDAEQILLPVPEIPPLEPPARSKPEIRINQSYTLPTEATEPDPDHTEPPDLAPPATAPTESIAVAKAGRIEPVIGALPDIDWVADEEPAAEAWEPTSEPPPARPVSTPTAFRVPAPAQPVPATRPDAVATRPARTPPEPPPLPPLALLDLVPADRPGYSEAVLEEMSRQVEILLRHFGVEVSVVAVEPGPVITRFELEPAPGVKVSQISNLVKDLARGLSVVSVRVVEVVPGKSVVGLEIPNQSRDTVYLSEIMNSSAYSDASPPLTIALGKDIGGRPVTANLAKMPHLLVAGTTGSGKSVAINAMLLSLLYRTRSDEVRLILIDPKMLELSIYEHIPHLLAPVVTDMKEAANALRWCVAEMERRFKLMASLKVRNIGGFNRQVKEAIDAGAPLPDPLYNPAEALDPDAAAPGLEPLPFIVVVIDELADMMMIVGKKVEELIARLAQKARAAGIHLILATQRPSVDVITGLIKANIPTRIAFQVSSRVDSRTILDQMGAEQLLGYGDMLYLPPGVGLPQRVHGAFVSDQEVNRVVEHLRATGQANYLSEILQESTEPIPGLPSEHNGNSNDSETDPLYDEAVRIVTETRRASISGVQRRLKVGYNRAARMIEEMEAAGIVGPLESNGNRDVLAPPPPTE